MRTLVVGNNNASSTFIGFIGGSIALTKNFIGTVTLTSSSSTYTGKTSIVLGCISAAKLSNAGVASSIGAPTGANATITLGGLYITSVFPGQLMYIGPGDSTDRAINIAGWGILDASGAGPIVFNGNLTTSLALTNGSLTLQGTNTDNNTIAGVISDGPSNSLSLVKSGSGTWLLTGTNTYTGPTAINNGTLTITGSLSNSLGFK